MKFYIDTANIEQIREANSFGLLDGVTTNPTLVAREKKGFKETIVEICSIVDGPVNAEVIAKDAAGMIAEGHEVASWADNVSIKIPMTPEGMKATKVLSSEGHMVNVTLVFSLAQALIACRAGATFISPFIGRVDDIAYDGMELVEECVDMIDMYGFDTEVIAASIRGMTHVLDSIRVGAHIATIPFATLMKLFSHPLTDKGIASFDSDWEKAGLGKIL
ncbi:MAG TPA: fructose-6-phosphate aldolase [bacterium]|nr:fructose-6-phosphate aldolase [bacterium]